MTTVIELFEQAGVPYGGVVQWNTPVPLERAGVYVLSTQEDPSRWQGLDVCPVSDAAVDTLLAARPEATVDGEAATHDAVVAHLRSMWLPGESVVYIGLTGRSVRKRMDEFYRTPVGARSPHAGGWPIKMLDAAVPIWVHFGAADDPDGAERAMMQRFLDGVREDVREGLIDPQLPIPYANLKLPGGRSKAHGFRGVKEQRRRGEESISRRDEPPVTVASDLSETMPDARPRSTQPITQADILRSQLRVPSVTKAIFPPSRAQIQIVLGDETYRASWDPRMGPDRERSGLIRLPRGVLASHVSAGSARRVQRMPQGHYVLD